MKRAGCGGSTPYPNSVAVDVEISPVSHEMFESNTDPLINAWTGTGGNDDEIGDKCAYDYGFIAANGVNIVLNGFPVQIQREFSNNANNDLGVGNGCTKRDGPAAVLSDPGTLKFGEVASGNTSEMDLLLQNNGGGDLNILNVRLGSGSSGFYSLLNVPPGWATLKTSESLTAKVQFAPTGGFIPSPSATVVVDTDVTTSPADENTTAVTGDIGVPPNAFCHDVTVNTDPNLCSTSNASIRRRQKRQPLSRSVSHFGPIGARKTLHSSSFLRSWSGKSSPAGMLLTSINILSSPNAVARSPWSRPEKSSLSSLR
jgi:hypothetical protein